MLSVEQKHIIIGNLITSGQGRQRLAASMISPLRQRRDYTSCGRKAFYVEQLPDGAMPVYDKDPNVVAYMVAEEGDTAIQFMTNTGDVARKEAIKYLHEGLSGARQLVICDPYFLISNSKISKIDYLSNINEVIPKTV